VTAGEIDAAPCGGHRQIDIAGPARDDTGREARGDHTRERPIPIRSRGGGDVCLQ